MSRWSDEMRKRYPDKSQAAEILADALANLNLGFESLNKKYDPESILDILRLLKKENYPYSKDYKNIILECSKHFKEINELFKDIIPD